MIQKGSDLVEIYFFFPSPTTEEQGSPKNPFFSLLSVFFSAELSFGDQNFAGLLLSYGDGKFD